MIVLGSIKKHKGTEGSTFNLFVPLFAFFYQLFLRRAVTVHSHGLVPSPAGQNTRQAVIALMTGVFEKRVFDSAHR